MRRSEHDMPGGKCGVDRGHCTFIAVGRVPFSNSPRTNVALPNQTSKRSEFRLVSGCFFSGFAIIKAFILALPLHERRTNSL